MTFRDRLQLACDRAGVPSKGRGRGAYLSHHTGVSQEGVRKWLELDSVPRRDTITKLAKLLGCDQVWLQLGIEPAESEAKRKEVIRKTNDAEDLLATLMSMAGWSVARGNEREADIIAIKEGRIRHIDVKALIEGKGKLSIRLPARKIVIDEVVIVEHLDGGKAFKLWSLDPRVESVSYVGSHLQYTFEKVDGALCCGGKTLKTFEF